MTEHTPGPWRVKSDYRHPPVVAGPDDGFLIIGGCGCCGSPWVNSRSDTREEELANARLIAAAPELLEALKRLVCDSPLENLEFACDAIAKAEGENQ